MRSARWTWPRYGDACNVFGNPTQVRRKFEVLDRHCERAGRDPAEITRTVVEFDARDLDAPASTAQAMAATGADGMIVSCPDEPARIAAIGRAPEEYFPSQTSGLGPMRDRGRDYLAE